MKIIVYYFFSFRYSDFVNSLDYISELKIKDKESLSKGYEVETHFFHAGSDYDLMITASPNSISQENFLKLHEFVLKTLKFD